MGEKTAGVGHFTIPTSPVIGTTVAQSASANTYTAAYVQLSAAAPAAIFITGVYVQLAGGTNVPTYMSVQLATGAAASEVVVGQHNMGFGPTSGVAATAWGIYKPIYPPIAVANGVRIAAKTASSVASALSWAVTLECINQANVVDDGVAVATVTTVTNQLTAAAIATGVWQDATAGDFTTASSIGKSLYTTGNAPGAASGLQICGSNAATTYATLTSTGAFTVNGVSNVSQTGDSFSVVKSGGTGDNAAIKTKTDFLPSATAGAAGGLFIAGTNAATTITTGLTTTFTGNLTGSVGSVTGAVGSVTAAVTLPSIPANWITAAGITAAALNGKGDWMVSYTQPTGFLAATFPSGTVANTTNITAGTITTATNLTNAPTAGDFTATMKTSLNAATPASVTGAVGSVTGITASDVGAIKTQTDKLVFTVANKLDVNVLVVNGVTVTGIGTAGSPWGPA